MRGIEKETSVQEDYGDIELEHQKGHYEKLYFRSKKNNKKVQ